MNGFVAIVLNSVVAASPTTPLPWLKLDDYPTWAFAREWEGVTAMELLVAPDGKPASCTVIQSSGLKMLDHRACSVAKARARFSPALGSDGRPVYGSYRSRIFWSADPYKWAQTDTGPDLEVSLSRLPGGATAPVDLRFAYLVDAQGNASDCTPLAKDYAQVLVTLGCEQLLAKGANQPAALPSRGTGPVVRTAWIRFTQSN